MSLRDNDNGEDDGNEIIWSSPVDGTAPRVRVDGETYKITRATTRFAVEPFRLVPRGTKHDGCRKVPCSSCRCYDALREVGDLVAQGANVAARMLDREDGAAFDGFLRAHGRFPTKFVASRWREQVLGELVLGTRERARTETVAAIKGEKGAKKEKKQQTLEEKRKKRQDNAAAREAGVALLAALQASQTSLVQRQAWARFCEDYPEQETLVWPEVYTYPAITTAVPQLSSQIAALLYRSIEEKWRQVRFKSLARPDARPFRFRRGRHEIRHGLRAGNGRLAEAALASMGVVMHNDLCRRWEQRFMRIVGAKWQPDGNRLFVACDCGAVLEHRADRWRVRCERCGAVGHLEVLREKFLLAHSLASAA